MKTFFWADCGSSSPAGESSRIQNRTGPHSRKRQPPQLHTASEAKRRPNPSTIIRGRLLRCQRTTTQLVSALFVYLQHPQLSAYRRRCPYSAGGKCEVGGEQRSIPPFPLPPLLASVRLRRRSPPLSLALSPFLFSPSRIPALQHDVSSGELVSRSHRCARLAPRCSLSLAPPPNPPRARTPGN